MKSNNSTPIRPTASAHVDVTSDPAIKPYLIRGIDPIPQNWELASSWDAMSELERSVTVAERLAAAADVAGDRNAAPELRRIRTACKRGLDHIRGRIRA
jgi:hypothetical protein